MRINGYLNMDTPNTPLLHRSVHSKLVRNPGLFFTMFGQRNGFSDSRITYDLFFHAEQGFYVQNKLSSPLCVCYAPEKGTKGINGLLDTLREGHIKDFDVALRSPENKLNFFFSDGDQLGNLPNYCVASYNEMMHGMPRGVLRGYLTERQKIVRFIKRHYTHTARSA